MNGGGAGISDGSSGQQYQQGNALSTAAMVAAATATATATASVVALQEGGGQFGQMPGGQQYNTGYGQQRGHGPMPMSNVPMNPMMHGGNMMGPGSMKMGQVYPRRLAPYPSPAMHMTQKRTQQAYPTGGPTMQPGFGPNPAANAPQYPNTGYGNGRPTFQTQYPPQQPLGPTGTFGPGANMRNGGTMRQATPPYTTGGAQYFNGSMGAGPGPGPGPAPGQFHPSAGQYSSQYGAPNGQFQQDVRNNMNYQHSPIPGNPTPPLTPASSMPPYISPNPDVKPTFSDLKPPMAPQSKSQSRSKRANCYQKNCLLF